MTSRRHPVLHRGTGALIVALMGLLACSDPGPTAPTTPVVMAAARGGGHGGGIDATPVVETADPNEAPQDTSLTVRVRGSGFDRGSTVEFLLDGQATTGMTVNRTKFVSDTDLDAELTIAADAETAAYDIAVTTSRGKKGIGTEMFTVKLNGNILFVEMQGDLVGPEQLVAGRNDARAISIKGDYALTLNVNLTNLVCDYDWPGKIPDEPGLLAWVQEQTQSQTLIGRLEIEYDKTVPDSAGQAGRVDSWTTTIGNYTYWVQFFRWATADLDENTNSTVVTYREASIGVFRMRGRRIISHEQCYRNPPEEGDFVNYDLILRRM
jgi:hypothetical protein